MYDANGNITTMESKENAGANSSRECLRVCKDQGTFQLLLTTALGMEDERGDEEVLVRLATWATSPKEETDAGKSQEGISTDKRKENE